MVMEFYAVALVKTLLLPPGGILTGIIAAVLIKKRYPQTGKAFCVAVALLGLLTTLPVVAALLATVTENASPIAPQQIQNLDAEAIVILAGGKDHGRLEYGGVTVSAATLQRIRYGAVLHRQLKLPVAVSGGVVLGAGEGEASMMRDVLEQEYFITPTWVEDRSRNTAQNAFYTRQLMGQRKIILVTHALHMRRSVKIFEQAGFVVVPAAVASSGPGEKITLSILDFLPSEKALVVTRDALHEWLGMIWYAIRYPSPAENE